MGFYQTTIILHNTDYIKSVSIQYELAIWNRLQTSKSKEDAIHRLQQIRNELLNNTFTPLNRRSTQSPKR